MSYFLNVNYEEGDQSTYKSIEISDHRKIVAEFDSGCFAVDYIDFLKWMPEDKGCNYSSSFDHFFMDGENYYSMLINPKTMEKVKYEDVPYEEREDLFEMPAPKHVRTHEELKKYYKQKKTLGS